MYSFSSRNMLAVCHTTPWPNQEFAVLFSMNYQARIPQSGMLAKYTCLLNLVVANMSR